MIFNRSRSGDWRAHPATRAEYNQRWNSEESQSGEPSWRSPVPGQPVFGLTQLSLRFQEGFVQKLQFLILLANSDVASWIFSVNSSLNRSPVTGVECFWSWSLGWFLIIWSKCLPSSPNSSRLWIKTSASKLPFLPSTSLDESLDGIPHHSFKEEEQHNTDEKDAGQGQNERQRILWFR